jgi:hypothetical protein
MRFPSEKAERPLDFIATGGMSAPVTAAKAASNAA